MWLDTCLFPNSMREAKNQKSVTGLIDDTIIFEAQGPRRRELRFLQHCTAATCTERLAIIPVNRSGRHAVIIEL